METLRQLSREYALLMELAGDPEDEEAFETTLESLTFEIDAKADSYADVIAAITSRASACKAEADRLATRAKTYENSVKRLKNRLMEVMVQMDRKKIETDLHTFSIQKNGGKRPLEIDEERVPDSYKRVILETDKELIRKCLDKGQELDFARYGETGSHLRIR